MSWIKDFRKARGLSQMQMAQFAGISRTYFSIPEIKPILPADLNALFLELKQEFELADIAIDNQPYISPSQKNTDFLKELNPGLWQTEHYVSVYVPQNGE